MKTTRHLIGSCLTVGIALTFGCTETPTTPEPIVEVAFARGGGKGGPKAPAAALTTRDAPDDRVWGDGADPYVDGEDKVDLRFDIADFHFEPASSRRGSRTVFLSFEDVLSGSDPFNGETQRLGYLSGFRVLVSLTSVPCGSPTAAPARFLWQDGSNARLYRLSLGIAGEGGDEVVITRTDGAAGDGRSTWTIESSGSAGLWEVSSSPDTFWGTFGMPFRFDVTGTDDGC